jgi:hypothetical protein
MLKEFKLYNNSITIRFDDEMHRFWDDKGNHIESVSGITGILDKSQALMAWAVNQMGYYLLQTGGEINEQIIDKAKKEYRNIKQEAADIGEEIHKWISEWILGKKPEMPEEDEKVINGITAFLKFQKENKIKWLESERAVYSKKYGYAGILDAVGKSGKSLLLVDFKSSNGVYPEMRFQVAGYCIAWEEENKKKIDKPMLIRLGKDTGEFEIIELPEIDKDKKAFLACLEIKKRLREIR